MKEQLVLYFWFVFPPAFAILFIWRLYAWKKFVHAKLIEPVHSAIKDRIQMEDQKYNSLSEIDKSRVDRKRAKSTLVATTGGAVFITALVCVINPIAGALVGIRSFLAIKRASEDYDAVSTTPDKRQRKALHS